MKFSWIILSHFKVRSSTNPNEEVNFRKLLLRRCQTEFESSFIDDEDMAAKKAMIDGIAEKDQTSLQEEFGNIGSNAHHRRLANMR